MAPFIKTATRADFYAVPTAGALWWLIFRHEYLPFRDGWVSAMLLLALAGLVLEGARLLLHPAPGGRAAACFDFARRVLLWTLFTGICATMLSRALETAKGFAAALENPYARNIMEGGQVLRAWLVSRGQAIYTALDGFPCLATVYAPLYYVVSGLASLAVSPPLFAGRLVSAASFASAILFVGLIVHRREKNAILAILLCLYLFQIQNFMSFARYARVDMLGWALFFLSVWLTTRGGEASRPGNRMLVLAALFMVLAALAKQQLAPLALGCAAYAALRRGLRPVLWYYVLPGLIAGGLALLMARLYFGEAFFLNTLTFPKAMAADPELNSTSAMFSRLKDFYQQETLLVLCFGAYAATSLFLRQARILDFVSIIQAPLLLLSLRWWGGDSNYFIGPVFMMAAGAAVFMKRLAAFPRFGPFLACILALLLVPSKMSVRYELEHFQDYTTPSLDDARSIRDVLAASNGRALVESEAGYLALFGEAEYFDAVETTNMSRYNLWRFAGSNLEKDILAVRFPVILNSSTFLLPEIHEAIDAGYLKEKTIGKIDVYRPRPPGQSYSLASLVPGGFVGPVEMILENLGPVEGEACYAPIDPARPGLLTLAVSSLEIMDTVSVRFFPRINADSPENALALSWSRDGEGFAPLYRLAGDGKDGWTPAWDIREERGAFPNTKTIFFRFELSGKAQLWLDGARPMRLWIVPPRSPSLGKTPDVG
jgi:hypothetical protein